MPGPRGTVALGSSANRTQPENRARSISAGRSPPGPRPPGRKDAERVGEWLVDQGVRPDVVVVSPSTRTRQTLEHLAQTQAYGGHQQHEAEADAKHVWKAAAHTEVHARGEQHHVVGAGRYRGDEGEGNEGEQQFG